MKVLIRADFDAHEAAAWQAALHTECAGVNWIAADGSAQSDADVALVANPPAGSLAGLPQLRLIQSLWAGVDRLLADPTLPAGVPIARMVDPAMTAAMVETVLWATLALHRGYFTYARQQAACEWREHGQPWAAEVPVLVLGAGVMGRACAQRLQSVGYRVRVWHGGAARAAADDGVHAITGPAALTAALPQTRVLINLLPLTAATRGLVAAPMLAALPRGASVVNLGRGAHVVDADLLAALDSGHLRHAVLDVFTREPLPADHPYWRHPCVTVLPHVAARTDPRSAARVVAENLRRLAAGQPLLHLVDRSRGY